MQRVIKRAALVIIALLVAGVLVLVGLNLWVVMATRDRIAASPLTCESREVGIVFGTSHGLVGGGSNPHYQARLDTAAQLYRLHRVSNLLLSGDNRTRYYNEPMTMWRDLRARNVPQQFMTLDYAGFSTFDTLVRAKKVFGVSEAILVTQPWHLPRALFIADAIGLDASGCPAISESQTSNIKLTLREWLARAATVGDLYLWGRTPRFLGPQERLPTPVLSPSLSVKASVEISQLDMKAPVLLAWPLQRSHDVSPTSVLLKPQPLARVPLKVVRSEEKGVLLVMKKLLPNVRQSLATLLNHDAAPMKD